MTLLFTDNPLRTFPRIRNPELSREAPRVRDTGHEAALAAFLGAVQDGKDALLPSDYGRDNFVSTYLNECSPECLQELFKACHEAMSGRDSTAAELLRDFVRMVGEKDYADEHEGCYV